MSQEQWNAFDGLVGELLLSPDPDLDAALSANESAGLPRIDVSPPQGKLLTLLARAAGVRTVLELGTLGGYSTICLARGVPADGSVITLESDAGYAEVAQANIDRAGIGGRVEVRVGAALDTLPTLEAEGRGPFDLIFIDADKQTYPAYMDWALRLSHPGTLIIGDNVVRGGTVLEPGDDASAQGARRFLEMLAEDDRVEATAIQTVGSKGYDGLAIALVL